MRSAYHQEMEVRSKNIGASSRIEIQGVGRNLECPSPPESQEFCMACGTQRHHIPTKALLTRRGLNVDEMCPRCGEATETTIHIVLLCKESKALWKLSPLRLEVEA